MTHGIGFSRLNWLGCDAVIPKAITNYTAIVATTVTDCHNQFDRPSLLPFRLSAQTPRAHLATAMPTFEPAKSDSVSHCP